MKAIILKYISEFSIKKFALKGCLYLFEALIMVLFMVYFIYSPYSDKTNPSIQELILPFMLKGFFVLILIIIWVDEYLGGTVINKHFEGIKINKKYLFDSFVSYNLHFFLFLAIFLLTFYIIDSTFSERAISFIKNIKFLSDAFSFMSAEYIWKLSVFMLSFAAATPLKRDLKNNLENIQWHEGLKKLVFENKVFLNRVLDTVVKYSTITLCTMIFALNCVLWYYLLSINIFIEKISFEDIPFYVQLPILSLITMMCFSRIYPFLILMFARIKRVDAFYTRTLERLKSKTRLYGYSTIKQWYSQPKTINNVLDKR